MGYVNGSAAGSVTAPPTAMMDQQVAGPYNGNLNRPATPVNPFTKAVKYNAKGRVALIGPAGGGKSLTALILARALAGPTGKIAAIDTEHGSLSKYADMYDFDVLELDSFSPEAFIDALHAAEQGGYAVFLCDSLSHFWTGKDGAFDFVDMAQKRHKDQQGGWKEFRPHERLMVDELITSPCHIICTMRTKTDYQEVEVNGKKKRVKIGLKPEQRDGLEYEFDLVGYMDEDNTFAVDKTRCPAYSQKAYAKPDARVFAAFVEWLKGAARLQPGTKQPVAEIIREARQIDTGGNPIGTQAAADHVARQKLQGAGAPPPIPPGSAVAATAPESWKSWTPRGKTRGEIRRMFAIVQEIVGEVAYLGEMAVAGVKDPSEFRKGDAAEACYARLVAIAEKEAA